MIQLAGKLIRQDFLQQPYLYATSVILPVRTVHDLTLCRNYRQTRLHIDLQ